MPNHTENLFALIHHLQNIGFTLPELRAFQCNVSDMLQPIFDHYKPMTNWSDHIGLFGYEMLEAWRTISDNDEPMVAWLQQFYIQLIELELDENQ